jgi:hypothetical protein
MRSGSGDVTERIAIRESVSRRMTMPIQSLEFLVVPISEALEEHPAGSASFYDASGRLPVDYLELVLARFALAESLGAEWGLRRGALQFDALFVWPAEDDALVLRILAAHGRLLVLAHEDRRQPVPAPEPRWPLPSSPLLVVDALQKATRYSLDWAAAAQTQCALERIARRSP